MRGIGGVQKPQLSSPREGASFPVGRLEPQDRGRIPLPKARPLVLRTTFQEQELFDDVLGLARRVDELLRESAARGEAAAPVFVEASEGEGAYRLAGRYRIEGNAVEVSVNVFRGSERVGRFTVRGLTADPDSLAKSIVGEADKLLKP